MNIKRGLIWLALVIVVLFLSCFTFALADRPAPKSIALDYAQVEIDLAEADEFVLSAQVSPEGASENYKWWVSDSSVLSVENGVVKCLKSGSAKVYVSVHGYGDVRAECAFTVSDSRIPERIVVYPSSIAAEPGTGVQLYCVAMPAGDGGAFVYSSSNTNVAVISESGYVSILNPGHATISVKSAYSDEIVSTIRLNAEYLERIKSISIAESTLKLEKGESYTISVVTAPEDGSRALVYSSSDEAVASVDQFGKITALSYGIADITVSSYRDPSIATGITVSVSDRDRPEEIVWQASGSSVLSPNGRLDLSIRLLPESALTDYVITSSREDIARVDDESIVAIKRGISVIRIQSVYREDLFSEFTLTVEDGSNVLEMPLRTTDIGGIDDNLARIERVKQSALDGLNKLYADGEIGKKEYERRVSTVESAFEMYAFPWTVDKLVRYWKAENSENGAKDFKPGVIYYGLPYTSGENHNRAYNVKRALEQGRYYAVEGESYYLMNRDSGDYATGYAGNDCSAFVAQALWGYTVYGEIVKTSTLYYDNRLRAFDDPMQLKAGDILVRHSSHVVMFLYWADEERTQAVFIQQGGSEPAINTVNTVVMELSYYTDNSYRLRRLAEY